jgi:phosphoglycerate dehydrogenase-like enzyme
MKAFIFDPLWTDLVTDKQRQKLADAGVETVVVGKKETLPQFPPLFEGYEDRMIVINPDYVDWNLTAQDYKTIPHLKAILGAATDYSWIDMSWANKHEIAVVNIRNFSTDAVADWAILMAQALARRIPELIKNDFPLDFDKDYARYRGLELKGKKAGIIGLGNVGKAIAKRCDGLGMKVQYWSHKTRADEYKLLDLEQLMETSDFIFPALELNDETRDMISKRRLQLMKPNAIMVSLVHGLFDELLVLEMVRKKKIFGFGLEAKPGSFKKFDGNVWGAPAYAWNTWETMERAMTRIVNNMVNAAEGKYPNQVNKFK